MLYMNGKIEDELLKENLDLINDILVNDFKFINNKEDLFIVGLECAYKLLSKSNKDNFSDILKRFLKVTIVNEIFNNLNCLSCYEDKVSFMNFVKGKMLKGRYYLFNLLSYKMKKNDYDVQNCSLSDLDDVNISTLDENINKLDDKKLITDLLKNIKDKNEIEMLLKHYYYRDNYSEISKDYNCSSERIRQKCQKNIAYLKLLSKKYYKPYNNITNLDYILSKYLKIEYDSNLNNVLDSCNYYNVDVDKYEFLADLLLLDIFSYSEFLCLLRQVYYSDKNEFIILKSKIEKNITKKIRKINRINKKTLHI